MLDAQLLGKEPNVSSPHSKAGIQTHASSTWSNQQPFLPAAFRFQYLVSSRRNKQFFKIITQRRLTADFLFSQLQSFENRSNQKFDFTESSSILFLKLETKFLSEAEKVTRGVFHPTEKNCRLLLWPFTKNGTTIFF